MAAHPELAAVDAYRLKNDLTWGQLSDQMKRLGIALPFRTLHFCCAHDSARDRTLFKVRKFLKLKHIAVKLGPIPRPTRRPNRPKLKRAS